MILPFIPRVFLYTFIALLSMLFLAACSNSSQSQVNGNQIVSMIDQDTVLAITQQKNTSYQIIDVRTPQEYQAAHISSAINLPHDKLINNPSLLKPYQNKALVFYCRSGNRVNQVLKNVMFSDDQTIYHLTGDMRAWQSNQLPVVGQ